MSSAGAAGHHSGEIGAGQIEASHVGSGLRQALRDAAADAAARTGDQGDPLIEAEVGGTHVCSFPSFPVGPLRA
jgi:hypothetical protein